MLTSTRRFMTIAMLVEAEPALSRRWLKHLRFTDPDQFRARCLVKVGRKVLFDYEALLTWLDEHRAEAVKEG